MAAQYYLYCTTLNNTVICRGDNSFAPLPPNTGELYYDILIPETQPLYLFMESGGTIVHSPEQYVEQYVEETTLPPTPDDYVKYLTFEAYSGTTLMNINARVLKTSIDIYTGTTAPALFVNVGGDIMTGSLSTSGNFTAAGLTSGSTVCGGTWIHTPIMCADTCVRTNLVCSLGAISAVNRISGSTVYGSTCIYTPVACGTTCVISPITCGSTRIQSPIVCGSTCLVGGAVKGTIVSGSTCVFSPVTLGTTCVSSPTICSSTCLCSTGTARFTGAITDASTLNVSGNTTLGSQLYLNAMSTGGTLSDYTVVWNPATKQLRSISPTGNACVYCYTQNTTPASTTSTANQTYLTATWTLPSGKYQMEFNMLYGNNTSNRCAITCFLLDGNVVGYRNLMKTNDTNVVTTAYVTQDTEFVTSTSHTFSIVYRQCGGGSALANYGAIRVQKIGA